MLLNLNGLSFLFTTDCVGGVFTQTMALARDFIWRGAIVIVGTIGPQPRADQIAEIAATGAEWAPLAGALDWMARDENDVADTAQGIADFARRRRVTSVHLHAPAYAAFGFDWPHVAACHSCHATWWAAVHPGEAIPDDLAWRARLTGTGLARARDTIAPSHSFAAALAEQYRLDRMPVAIPNGAEPDSLPPVKIRHGAVAAGRFWDPAKNLDGLRTVAEQLTQDLVALGPLPDAVLPTSPLRLKTHGAVPRNTVRERFAAAQVFVSSALYEPFGLAALEAAQAGLALVLSDIPAHRENWDGVAIFRDPRDTDGLVRVINQLFANPDEAEERGLCAQERAARFSVERMGETTALTHLNPRKGRIAA